MIYRFSLIEKILLSKDVIAHPFADAASSVGLGFALGSAIKLKIADALSAEPREVTTIAGEAGVSELGAELVLDCLEALGYVAKSGTRYSFTKRGYKNLSSESPDNFRYFILFCDYLYKGYLRIDETVRVGKRPQGSVWEELTDWEWELYARAMIDVSKTNLQEVTKKIPVPGGAKRLLDLGGSHGLYSIEFCKKNPELKAQVVDLEPVRKYCEESIQAHNSADRVSFLATDFMNDDIPGDNDVVLAFNVIHGFSAEENRRLAGKVAGALRKGGLYVVLDQIKGVGGKSQLSRATTSYMALNLLHQSSGKTYSYQEVDSFAKDAGFARTKLKKLHAPGFGLVICYK